jgi:hypothetical protein
MAMIVLVIGVRGNIPQRNLIPYPIHGSSIKDSAAFRMLMGTFRSETQRAMVPMVLDKTWNNADERIRSKIPRIWAPPSLRSCKSSGAATDRTFFFLGLSPTTLFRPSAQHLASKTTTGPSTEATPSPRLLRSANVPLHISSKRYAA